MGSTMTTFLIRRLLLMVPTFFLGTIIIFFMIRLIPGNELAARLGEDLVGQSEPDLKALEHQLGFDKPYPVQYWNFISHLFKGNLGTSAFTGTSIADSIESAAPVTIELAMLAIVVSLAIAIPIGVISAIKQDTPLDLLLRSFAIAGLSVPSFWVGTLALVLPAIWFHWSPPVSYVSLFSNPLVNLEEFILPAAILGLALAASVMRMTRSMVLEVMRQDYVRTARAKGLQGRTVVARHIVKNALIPVLTILGLQIAFLIGGSIILESIFTLPGLGLMLITALTHRDYPTIQGINVVVLAWVLIVDLLIDLSYRLVDPRIQVA